MASTTQSKKRLALAILDFLQKSQTDGSVAPEDAEQLEIAANCIGEAFKVDTSDTAALKDALGDQNLLAIYNVYEKLKGKTTASTEGASSASEARPATPQTPSSENLKQGPGAVNKDEAERLKGLGNAAMKKENYTAAIDYYTEALKHSPGNAVLLSNRAAAYSAVKKHNEAKRDAEAATKADHSYLKGWSRLGHACWQLGDAEGAMKAYKEGIDAGDGSATDAMRRGYETARKKVEEDGGNVAALDEEASRGAAGAGGMPDFASLLSSMGGGAGGANGMGGLAGLMNSPMMRQVMESPMAQQLMSNPSMLQGLMNNPQARQMAEQLGQGGGMPDISAMMQDPSVAEMARNLMGGAGQGGAGGAPGGSS